jgi:hypothetical protein
MRPGVAAADRVFIFDALVSLFDAIEAMSLPPA